MKNELRKTGNLKPVQNLDVPRSAINRELHREGIPSNQDPNDVAPIKRQINNLRISLTKQNRKHHPGTQN